jgi:hypothetical protein
MSTYNFTLLILIGLLSILITSLYSQIVEAQTPTIKVNWVVHSNPTGYSDFTFGICEAKDYIYVVGGQSGERYDYARIEMRYKSNGTLVKAWASEDFLPLTDCIIINDKLYAVNKDWDILVFDLSLNLLKFKLGSVDAAATSITHYGNYLYIAGWEVLGWYGIFEDRGWRIEKWEIESLTFVKEYTINPTLGVWDLVFVHGINPVTEQIWVVGEDNSFRVEILDLDLNYIKTIRNKLWSDAYGIDFDEEGNVYISGFTFIVKYDKYGNEVKSIRGNLRYTKLLYANNLIYVAATEILKEKHILIVYDANLNEINKKILGSYEGGWNYYGKMAFDGKNLYIAGDDYTLYYDREWTIYSITFSSTEGSGEDFATSLILWAVISVVATVTLSLVFIWFKRKHKRIRIKTKPRVPPPPV